MPTRHYCLDEGYPFGKLVCFCIRGEDHEEDLFDIPLDNEE